MTLPVGPNSIGFNQVNIELGFPETSTIGLNDAAVRTLFGVSSGQIDFDTGRGKSNSGSVGTTGYWFNGGDTSITSFPSTIQGIIFASDTLNVTNVAMNTAKGEAGSVSSKTKAYSCGGDTNSSFNRTYTSNIDSLVFATVTPSSVSAVLNSARTFPCGIYSGAKGYLAGGYTSYDTGQVNTIQALTYSSDAIATLSATLAAVAGGANGMSGPTKGFIAGGGNTQNPGAGTLYNTLDKLTFSSELRERISVTLAYRRQFGMNMMSDTVGYLAAGFGALTGSGSSTYIGKTEAIPFSTETPTTLSANMTSRNFSCHGISGRNAGYQGTGYPNATTVTKFTFSSETEAALGSSLSSTGNSGQGTSSGQPWN